MPVLGSIKNESLKLLVHTNVRKSLERTRQVAPQPLVEEALAQLLQGARSPVNIGVADLIELATSPQALCRMEPTWHPWF